MISFVLPVYNCYDKVLMELPELISKLQVLNIDYEIIIVDDGSKFKADIRPYGNRYCKLLINKKNYGKGYSVKRGIMAASGNDIIFMDGDFPFDLEIIERLVDKLQKPNVDIVIGDRTLQESSYAEATSLRMAGSKIISFILSRFVTQGYRDTQCGIKAFKKVVAKDIFSKTKINGFSFDIEVLFIAIKRKYRIEKINVKVGNQLSSNVKVIFHGTQMLLNIFRIQLNNILGLYK